MYALILIVSFLLYTVCVTGISRWMRMSMVIPHHMNHMHHHNLRCVKGWISQWNGYRWDCCPSGERSILVSLGETINMIETPFHGLEKDAYDTTNHLTVCKYGTTSGVFCLVSSQCESHRCTMSTCE